MTYWLITTTLGHFQFNDEMGSPIHYLSGLLAYCNFISMVPIEAESPIPAPVENSPIERVDVNPPKRHEVASCGTKISGGRTVGSIDHCGHCGSAGHRRSRLMKCGHSECRGHCTDCIDGPSCHWND